MYINSGVMIMNIRHWREASIKNMFEQTVIKRKGKQVFINDQDLINIVFKGKIALLSPRYNVTNMFWGINTPMLPAESKAWAEGRKSPVVIHFTNSRKPWKKDVWHPYKQKWIDTLKNTPWKDEAEAAKATCNYHYYISIAKGFVGEFMDKLRLLRYNRNN